MKKLNLIIFFTILTLLSFAGIAAAATVTIESSATTVNTNETINLNLYLSDASDLYGASVDFKFDPAVVQIIKDGSTPTTGGNAVTVGQVLPASGYVLNQFDNTAGTVNFAELLIGNVSGVNVSNNTLICTIPLKAVGNGAIPIVAASYDAAIQSLSLNGTTLLVHLSDSSGKPISYATPQNKIIQSNGTQNTGLSSLAYNGTPVDGFTTTNLNYNVKLPAGTIDIPVITATKVDPDADISIDKATNLNGTLEQRTSTITVTAQDGTTKVYKVTFSVGMSNTTISDLSATPGDGQVTLTFSTPTGASSISLMQKSGSDSYTNNTNVILTESSKSAVVTGLANGTSYTFELMVVGGSFEGTSNEVKATPTAQGVVFNIGVIPDNTLKLGDDFFDLGSDAIIDPQATIPIASLLKEGSNKNKAYFKFGGKWYAPFDLTDEQFLNPAYALSDEQVNAISGFNEWYKPGSEIIDLKGLGTYTITPINQFSSAFSITINNVPGAAYYNVYKKSNSTLVNSVPVAISNSTNSMSAVFSSVSDIEVWIYSDAGGTNKIEELKLEGDSRAGILISK